jgi:hypothetical protein
VTLALPPCPCFLPPPSAVRIRKVASCIDRFVISEAYTGKLSMAASELGLPLRLLAG